MADLRSGIAPGDTVVVVDPQGQPMRHHGHVLRGIVLSIAFGSSFRAVFGDHMATVSLARSGRQVAVGLSCLRRCPQLAYVRPPVQELSPRGGR